MLYRTNWPLVLFLALALHGGVFGVFQMLRPLLLKDEPVPTEMGQIIDLGDAEEGGKGEDSNDPGFIEGTEDGSLVGEALPDVGISGIREADIASGPDAEKDMSKVKEAEQVPEPLMQDEVKVDPEPEADPIIAKDEADAIKQYQKQVAEAQKDPKKKVSNTIVIQKKGSGKAKQIGQPPITLSDSYPPEGMYTFKGVIRVFTTIGEDGKVKATKVAVSSGRRSADELAQAFCRRWTFKPARDGEGKPMESVKLIRIPFNLSPEKMKDQMDRNG